ncbi:peptidase [Sphingomonas aracearum]|uniref:peptidase n=1 Tax=Sphingomonas aracearum TaxID=2283317 RepID=UPI0015F028E1|nr:peptidase [Sphingomonas aracearum]
MNAKLLFAAALGAAALGLSGCDDYAYGGGSVAVGYGAPGYGYGYVDPYYDGYGYGYGALGGSYGWYNDFYYPGSGVYVYDRNRRPFRWNDGQRRYWEGRRGNGYRGQPNWGGFYRNDRPGYGRPGQGRPDLNGRPGYGRPGQGRPDFDGRPGYQGRPGNGQDGRWNGNRGTWRGNRGDRPAGGWQGRPSQPSAGAPAPQAPAATTAPSQGRPFRWGGSQGRGGGRRGN